MIAPAYTITWTAATNSAWRTRNSAATTRNVHSSDSAECTGLRNATTPTPPATAAAASA